MVRDPRHVKQMMITTQENTGTEAQSDPDSSSVPIVSTCVALTDKVFQQNAKAQTVGQPSIGNPKCGANRLYPARNGAMQAASVWVFADGFIFEPSQRRHQWAGNWSISEIVTA